MLGCEESNLESQPKPALTISHLSCAGNGSWTAKYATLRSELSLTLLHARMSLKSWRFVPSRRSQSRALCFSCPSRRHCRRPGGCIPRLLCDDRRRSPGWR